VSEAIVKNLSTSLEFTGLRRGWQARGVAKPNQNIVSFDSPFRLRSDRRRLYPVRS
jgi:hypothetical protein